MMEPEWEDSNKNVGKENAVDGLYNDRGTGGQCAISADNALTAFWYVDLGSVQSISHVDIYYRTDNANSMGFFYIHNSIFINMSTIHSIKNFMRILCFRKD